MNNNYRDLIKEEERKDIYQNGYEIYVRCDANDGDYLDDTFYLDDITKDELMFLVMCYLNTHSAFGHKKYPEACFGNFIDKDMFFDWLWDYCINYSLLLFAGMCDCFCHSVEDISITHLSQGKQYSYSPNY